MANMSDLQKDKHGNIISNPVTGWITASMAETAVLLAVQYVESPEQFKKGNFNQIQLGLMPQQCLELAETLKRAAAKILDNPSTQKPS